jgi:DHA2 family multidrug resistance protein-like MFS transporter
VTASGTTNTAAAPRAGRREWIGLSVLMLALLLVSMDVSVLYFAVPFISRELEPSAVQQLWIFDIYGFVLAGLLITMGSLGDRIGRRKLLMMGAVAFSLASLVSAYATTPEMLIAARALLGIGGATLMPSTLALIRNMFRDDKQRGTAIAVWGGVMSSGIALGPVISGLLLEHFWWGSVFLINLPVMVLLLVLAPMLLPEYKAPQPGRFDLLSSLLSLAAVLPVIYGIKEAAKDGFGVLPGSCIAAGLLVGIVFVRRQRNRANPMIDLTMYRNKAFSGSVLVNMLAMFVIVGYAIFLTQYLQSVRGMGPLTAALWSVLPSVAVGGVVPLAASLAQRINRGVLIAGGFAVAALGFAWMSQVHEHSPLWFVLVGAVLYASGTVAVMTQVTDLALGQAPPERAGSVSAQLESATEFGGALGMALLGAVQSAIYANRLPDSTPAEAKETLGGALSEAAKLPGRAGQELLEAARSAFVDGMSTVAMVVSGVCVLGAALALAMLRGTGKAGAAAEAPEGAAPAEGAKEHAAAG